MVTWIHSHYGRVFEQSSALRRAAIHLQRVESAAEDQSVTGWLHALDRHDRETEQPSVRVTDLALQLARHLGFGSRFLERPAT